VAIALCIVAPLDAQEIVGTLRAEPDARLASGVVVTVNRASDGALVARAVTGERGTFRLTVTTDSLVVRALRIGHQPYTLGALRVAAGARRDVSAILPDARITLATFRAQTDNRCRTRADGAVLVAQLFTQARTALLSSELVSDDGRPQSRYRLVSEHWNARGELIDSLRGVTEEITDSLRAFQSVSVDSLVASGYVVNQSDGSTVYRAPDAHVLVDDRFLSNYCLQLANDHAEQSEWIGVSFRPVRTRRGINEVQGTLWLDRTTYALQQMEFSYLGLDVVTRKANPGGWMAFDSLRSGAWFVSRWEIRMPKVARRVEVAPRSIVNPDRVITEQRVLLGWQHISGDVLSIAVNGEVQYAADVAVSDPIPAADIAVDATRDTSALVLSVPDTTARAIVTHLPTPDSSAFTSPTSGAMLLVRDASNHPIPYALVYVGNSAARATDSLGRVLLARTDQLNVDVRVQRIGFVPHQGAVTRASLTAPFVVSLLPANPTLSEVRAVAPRNTALSRTGFYDRMDRVRRGAIVGEFVAPEELELRAQANIAQALYGKRYVTVRGSSVFGRGGCRMQVLLDGKLMEGNRLDAFVGGNEVMAIEVYASTANAPAELIPLTNRGSCGIVALWTGPRR
jgi:hypothetical protein